VSWLYYSDRLLEFPLGVFGIALATVILPNLSRKHAAKSVEAFSSTLDWALRLALLITLPAAVGLAVLSGPILVTLFQHGAFSAEDVAMSTLSLFAYALGLPAFIAVKVLAPGYYARQDTRTPVKFGLLAMAVNMLLNLAFVGGMLAMGFAGPHAGLAAASSAAAFLNAALLFRGLHRNGSYQPRPGWGGLALAIAAGCLAMALALGLWAPDATAWASLSKLNRVLDLCVYIALGALVYLLVAVLAGLRRAHFRHQVH
jgi:putative peptidoglycan lipid II flippase